MQYPGAFILMVIAQFANTLVGFIGVWALFARFGHVGGWTLGQVALFYGVITMAFALADMISRGFDVFGPEFVKTGAFDRILLRPRPTSLQVAGFELRLTPIGRLAQGALVLAIGVHLAHVGWTPAKAALVAFAIAGGVAVFYGLLVLQATLAFWTIESLEIANIATYGGMQGRPTSIRSMSGRGLVPARDDLCRTHCLR